MEENNINCIMIVNGINREISFRKNDYNVTFIYLDNQLICIFIPEDTRPDIISDIKRVYADRPSMIFVGDCFDEVSFLYGMSIGMSNWREFLGNH